jgi:hypothetical protein
VGGDFKEELLTLAENAGFDLLLTTDKNVRYQQNLAGRKISIVVLGNSPWWLVRQHLDAIVAAVNAATPGSSRSGSGSVRKSTSRKADPSLRSG